MSAGKKRSAQHLIDQDGVALLRSKLPHHWVLREYWPDYGLDFTVEVFKPSEVNGRSDTYETFREHVFIQLKSVSTPEVHRLKIFGRHNVEKTPEKLVLSDQISEIENYRIQLEMSELVTVERMGIGVPVLLVIADRHSAVVSKAAAWRSPCCSHAARDMPAQAP